MGEKQTSTSTCYWELRARCYHNYWHQFPPFFSVQIGLPLKYTPHRRVISVVYTCDMSREIASKKHRGIKGWWSKIRTSSEAYVQLCKHNCLSVIQSPIISCCNFSGNYSFLLYNLCASTTLFNNNQVRTELKHCGAILPADWKS